MSKANLADSVRSLRLLTWLVQAAGALVGFATVFVAAALFAFWVDLVWDLSGAERVSSLILAGLCGIAYLALWQWRSRNWNSTRHAARQIDEAVSGGGLIVSSWELASRSGEFDNQLTAGMSEMAIADAAKLSTSVSAAKVVSKRPLKTAGLCLVAVLAVVAIVSAISPSLADAQWRRFARPYSDTPPFSTYTIDVQPGDTSVVYRESLDIIAVIDGGPVEHADLILEREGKPPEVIPMFQQADKAWRTSLVQFTEPANYFVRAVDTRSEKFAIDVITVPEIADVRVRISPPAYTNRTIFEGEFPPAGVSGLAGTRVQVRASSNRPLSSGQVTLRNGSGDEREIELVPQPEQPNEVVGEFEIEATESLELRLVDTAGEDSVDVFKGNIQLIDDRDPYVRLVSPRRNSLATATANIPISLSGEDDFGIASVQLYRSLNHSRPLPTEPKLEAVLPRLTQRWVLPLKEYNLSPGDEIRVFARVEDNDPAGAKGAETEVATVRIISNEEFDKLNRRKSGAKSISSKYRNAQRRLEKLRNELQEIAAQLKKEGDEGEITAETKAALEDWIQQWNAAADAIEADANKPMPVDLDRNLVEQLKLLSTRMRQASDELAKKLDDDALTKPQLRKDLDDLLKRIAQNEEKIKQDAVDPVAEFERVFPFRKGQQQFLQLVRWQRDLSERLRPFENTARLTAREKTRFRDLEVEQHRLRETLVRLLDELVGHAQALPVEQRWNRLRTSTLEFVAAVRESGATDEMSNAEAAIIDLDGNRAVDSAVRAADILASFLDTKGREMGDAADDALQFNPQLQDNLGQTMAQMLSEMGFGDGKPGAGSGEGAGRGMSSTENIGLYGGQPEMIAARSTAGSDSDPINVVLAPGEGSDTVNSASSQTTEDSAVSASADVYVPLQFRERIGLYRERILQESRQGK